MSQCLPHHTPVAACEARSVSLVRDASLQSLLLLFLNFPHVEVVSPQTLVYPNPQDLREAIPTARNSLS